MATATSPATTTLVAALRDDFRKWFANNRHDADLVIDVTNELFCEFGSDAEYEVNEDYEITEAIAEMAYRVVTEMFASRIKNAVAENALLEVVAELMHTIELPSVFSADCDEGLKAAVHSYVTHRFDTHERNGCFTPFCRLEADYYDDYTNPLGESPECHKRLIMACVMTSIDEQRALDNVQDEIVHIIDHYA